MIRYLWGRGETIPSQRMLHLHYYNHRGGEKLRAVIGVGFEPRPILQLQQSRDDCSADWRLFEYPVFRKKQVE